jgi:hypothetical protein
MSMVMMQLLILQVTDTQSNTHPRATGYRAGRPSSLNYKEDAN